VVAYQLLTGDLPRLEGRYRQYLNDQNRSRTQAAVFQQTDPIEMYEALISQPVVVWPSAPKNEYESRLRDIVDQCLHLDPHYRPVDCREVALMFEQVRHEADQASLKQRHAAQLRGKQIKIYTLLGTTGIFVICSALLLTAALIGLSKLSVKVFEVKTAESKRLADLAKQKVIFDEKVAAEERARQDAQVDSKTRQQMAESARSFLKFSQDNADRFFTLVLDSEDVDFPGFQEDRKKRLEDALTYFDQFRRMYGSDPGFAEEVARAHQFVGDVKRAQGRLSEAVVDLLTARDFIDQMPKQPERETVWQWEAARIERKIAELELIRGEYAAANLALTQSTARFQKLAASQGDATVFQLNENLYLSSQIKLALDDRAGASAELKQVTDSLMELQDKKPLDEGNRALLAKAFSDIGFIFRKERQVDGAREMQRKAAEIFAELIQLNPQVEDYQYHLAVCLNQEGELRQDTAKLLDAVAFLDRICKMNPEEHLYRFELANSYGRLAEIQRDAGQPQEALRLNTMSVEFLAQLSAAEPSIKRYQFALARQRTEMAQLLADTEKFKEAAALLAESTRALQALLQAEPNNEDYMRQMAKTLGHGGFAMQKLGDTPKAQGQYQVARQAWGEILKVTPKDEEATSAIGWLDNQLKRLN